MWTDGYNQALAAAGIEKRAQTSNLAQDFMAGMDPLGIWTNPYGREAERAGLSEKEHALKRGVGTLGGAVGGAAVVPSAVFGTVEALKGLDTPGTWRQRLAIAGAAGLAGAKRPIQSIFEGTKGREALRRIAGGGEGIKPRELEALKYVGGTLGATDEAMETAGAQFLRQMPKGEAAGLRATKDYARFVQDEELGAFAGDLLQRNPKFAEYMRQLRANAARVPDAQFDLFVRQMEATHPGQAAHLRLARRLNEQGDTETLAELRDRFIRGEFDEHLAGDETPEYVGAHLSRWQDPEQIRQFSETPTGRAMAAGLEPHVGRALSTAKAQLGLAGLIGGGGAYYQYGAGRQTERETSPMARLKRRLGIEQ